MLHVVCCVLSSACRLPHVVFRVPGACGHVVSRTPAGRRNRLGCDPQPASPPSAAGWLPLGSQSSTPTLHALSTEMRYFCGLDRRNSASPPPYSIRPVGYAEYAETRIVFACRWRAASLFEADENEQRPDNAASRTVSARRTPPALRPYSAMRRTVASVEQNTWGTPKHRGSV